MDSVEEWLGDEESEKPKINTLPGKNETLQRRLMEYEDKIRNRKTEKAVIFDKDGNVIIDKSGGKRKVGFMFTP